MKTSSRCGNSPRTLGEDGLIALAIRSLMGALDVRRKRNMPQTLQMLANAALIVRNKSERPQAKLTARKNLAFQFALAEEYSLANLHLAARPGQRLPSFGVEFARQEDFDFPCEVLRFRGSPPRGPREPPPPPPHTHPQNPPLSWLRPRAGFPAPARRPNRGPPQSQMTTPDAPHPLLCH